MIARVWMGKTKIEYSERYEEIIVDRDIPGYRNTKGFVKHTFLKRTDDQYAHFKLITCWEDLESIKNLTGPNFEMAFAYDDDEKYLLDFPGSVEHYKVFSD